MPTSETGEREGRATGLSVFPLSSIQRQFWLLERMKESSASHIISVALRLRGPLRTEALGAAVNDLVARHEALRTIIRTRRGEPVQVVLPRLTVDVPVTDLTRRPPAETEQEVLRRCAALGALPFDLAKGPLLRIELFRTGEDQHVLMFAAHHIIADARSLDLLTAELAEVYRARLAGETPRLTPPGIAYGDFAAWQQEFLAGPRAEPLTEFWRERLAGAPELLTLPWDHPRPAVPSGNGDRVPLAFGGQRLAEVCRAEGCTPYMVFLAAFQYLLGRHAGQDDVCVATAVVNRTAQTENVFGCFVNTLVLRTRLAGAGTFGELVRRVRDTALRAFQHNDMPFDRLVEELAPQRDASRNPIAQAMLVVHNSPAVGAGLPGLSVEPVELPVSGTQLDVNVQLWKSADGFTGFLEWNTDLFDRSTMTVLAGQFTRLLEGVLADPGAPLATVDLLGEAERDRLRRWNDTGPAPEPANVPELFARRAAASPQAVAVRHTSGELTYADLDARSDHLARTLAGHGVGPEVRVAVALPRSAELAVAVLAVFKAGGVYVPLDAGHPRRRREQLLADARPAVVLTAPGAEGAWDGERVLVVDCSGPVPAGAPVTVPLRPDNAAYVIYTSGSTGTPKGVTVTHGGIANLARDHIERFGVTTGSRLLQVVSTNFDVSVGDLLIALLSGATLVLEDGGGALVGERISRALADHRVTHVMLPPTLLATLPACDLPALRHVVVGGEICPPDLVERWAPGRTLHNAYGPTETTVCVTTGELPPGERRPALGTPVAGTTVHLLDDRLRPVPSGVLGEVYVGGTQLARGYAGRPGATAERFVASPFGPAGARLYRTGDLARWIDGGLRYAGRSDRQLKVRGLRVDPGEIEAALCLHDAVDQAAVVLAGAADGTRVLAAYTVPGAPEGLRDHVAGLVPEHMVPAVFTALAELPLTPNGKLDHGALPEPGTSATVPARTSPRGAHEEILAGLIAEILGLPEVGADESFFALGGHSLLGTSLISRVRSVLGVELTMRDLLDTPTAEGLARKVTGADRARPELCVGDRPEVVPLSLAQARLWFLNRLEDTSATYNMPIALRLSGPLDVTALTEAVGDLLERHESLRTVFPEDAGVPRQVVLPAAEAHCPVPVTGADRDGLTGAVAAAAAEGFDLTCELPVRVRLFALDATEHLLLVVVHHIAGDGGSMAPMARDLATAYQARRRGAAPRWETGPVQYPDFALWQREVLGDVDDATSPVNAQSRYWTEALAGLPDELELPTDRPRPAVATYRGGSVPFTLEPELHRSLLALTREHQTTLFMVLQAGLAALLTRLGAGTDIPLGTPIAGRTDAALDDAVGFFVNTLVLRTRTDDNPTFAELLHRVRETDLAAYANQDLPFDRLVEELRPSRSLARHPLFQVMIILQNQAPAVLDLPGLSISLEDGGAAVANVDLTVEFVERTAADGGPGGIAGSLEYSLDLFDRSTAERWAPWLTRLLTLAVADPQRRLDDFTLLDEAERQTMVEDWNRTEAPVPACGVHELIEDRAAETPAAPAVECGTVRLTYVELNERANRLARWLRDRGVRAESPVAVCVRPGADLVVALLAILKAGAAFVPLDPASPAERLAGVVEAVDPRVLLAQRDPAGAVTAAFTGRTVLLLDEDWPEVEPYEEKNLGLPVAPGGLAALFHTSGSTGRPKGAMFGHEALVNYTVAMIGEFRLRPADRILQLASIAFDVLLEELLPTLAAGATVVLPETGILSDGTDLTAYLADHAITGLELPTAYWHEWVREIAAAANGLPPALRFVAIGGERVLPVRLAEWQRLGAELIHVYGLTEVTVTSTVHRLPAGAGEPVPAELPIGRPVANTRLYVLDHRLRPVPVGVAGELYIGGSGLDRGYLGQPALTATRFVADPFAPGPGARMYRSGDLVRWGSDGSVVFLGRTDHQVKVRGYRVELGEVESALSQHPQVRHAVALVREEEAGDKQLVAYVSVEPPAGLDEPVDGPGLRRFTGQLLPDYMVPSVIMLVERFPLNANGKVDRALLPAPVAATTDAVAPRTPAEETVALIFAGLLGRETVGVHDNFFELGGHSLLVMRLAGQVRDAFGVEVPLRAYFESPTVAALALRVVQEQAELVDDDELYDILAELEEQE